MNQTAVEWLVEQISSSKYFYNLMEEIESRGTIIQPNGILEQAKEMEKEQIINAVYDGMGTNFDQNIWRARQYYNQKYKQD